jgi:tetratricopeptide (TPR) repeat protein
VIEVEVLRRELKDAFRRDPREAMRVWFRLQEDLHEDGEVSRVLAQDLWELRGTLGLSAAERARFDHTLGVFFGTPGPACDLLRARECFAAALEVWTPEMDPSAHARAQHNWGNALNNLASGAPELREAVACFDRALEYRSEEFEIARAVTFHSRGIALRRLAGLSREGPREPLEKSMASLAAALEIRERLKLRDGTANSLLQLGLSQLALAALDGVVSIDARQNLARAAADFEALGLPEKAALARSAGEG